MQTEIESLNRLHREMVARARQTNSEADWQDAQSMEHMASQFQAMAKEYDAIGNRLGALEAFAISVFVMSPDSAAVNIFKQIEPAIYKQLVERHNNGHKPT